MAKTKALPIMAKASDFARFMEREMEAATFLRHGRWETWRGFISWTLASYQNDDARMSELEARLPEAVEAWKAWRTALEGCAKANPYDDALGVAYMAIGAGNKYFGQFFTPAPVARLMAAISVGDQAFTEDKRFLLGCEPTCGSGVMVLAAAEHRESLGLPPVIFQAMDLDTHVAEMAAIQFYLADIPALVLSCDSLLFGMAPDATATVISPRVQTQEGDEPPRLLKEVSAAGAALLLERVREHAEAAWARRTMASWLATGATATPAVPLVPPPGEASA